MKFILATFALLATAQAAAMGERRAAPGVPVDPVHLIPSEVVPSVVPGVPGRPLSDPLPGAPALPLKGREEEPTPIKGDAPSASGTGKPTPTESEKPEKPDSPLGPLNDLIGGLGLPL
ncbi:uncharacterized protein DNG_05608 [Cephalotrichum gorgonifer]|uniref:Uncharacterized protein n=1 Tax=Cephalotrichum gorgonifer TaxID=2041049 RepID=A0AAE8MYI5_9PEZI|nr:uncharacterized protein DNG_05608 [Cephalotrichum gorgonifer]